MQVSVETSSGLERRMRVQVPAEKIEKEVESRLQRVGRTAKIKGFRPGKIPPKVIRQQYGDQVRQEVLQEVLQSSYSEAVVQEKLQPAGGPSIEPESLEEGKDLAYTAVFEVYPEFDVKGVDKIKVKKPVVDIAAEDIESMVDNLRKQRADWQPVDRKAADDDQVKLDFTGTLNGEEFEGGSATDFIVVLGGGQMLPDFEKNLQGVKAGDEKKFKVKFPKDYHATELAGQKAEFAIKVSEVSEQVLPEVDAEFIKAYGIESGERADLDKDIEQNMQRELETRVRTEVKKQLMDGLLAANRIDIPGVLVNQECDAMQKETMQRMGITDENQAPAADSFSEAAEKRVRLGLLLSQVIKENEIEIDRDKVNAKVDELCAPYDNPEEIRNIYLQNPQFMGQIENMVLEEQVVDWLEAQATVSDRKMGFMELMELSA
jgi:trigger factor